MFLHFVTLDRWPFDHKIISYVGYPNSQGHFLHQAWTLWNHPFLSYCEDKQTDRQNHTQTDADGRLTHATTVGVSNNAFIKVFKNPNVLLPENINKKFDNMHKINSNHIQIM